MAAKTAVNLYNLYLNGYDCNEIVRLNPQFDLGTIVDARVRYGWDEKKAEHLKSLFDGVAEKVKKTQVESVQFLTDLLAASNKCHGDQLKKYLQTGDPKDLPAQFTISGIDSYRKIAELLMKLTGQDGGGKGGGGGTKIQIVGKDVSVNTGPNKDTPAKDSAFAKDLLALLNREEGEE